ncbi:voltage-dependent calcium channel subunit alpha-2/delta-3-like isoform X2 [Agrilus planipennis]|uniref:Voltage-dependent calcium channel subunit alpha-2/delta-3-like isoform X2 n=1 Tax=Agrilus planipennis TaxID=224129 RepID=A0A1W4XCA0_AGRPL|nr:voltage-dependent calcium channel subunit alpha-2/delta-3-like isoform X2 [Agrilus planipennis]
MYQKLANMHSEKRVLMVVKILLFVLFFSKCLVHVSCQEATRELKTQPDLLKIVRNWAQKLGAELKSFGEMVTRRTFVVDSFKRYTIENENGDNLVKQIADRISNMMEEKVKAVRRIMEVAENKAVSQGDYVEPNFDFYNAKNLINPLVNESEEEATNNNNDNNNNHYPHMQEVRNNNDESDYDEKISNNIVVQDQESIETEEQTLNMEHPSNTNIEVTDELEEDAQASQKPPTDKRRLPLRRNPHFNNIPVNTNFSAVHVPSNVFERSKEVIKGIKWSEELDQIFRSNYKNDPNLSWQYFGSSTGFMRFFPAMNWSQEPVDLYDCRTRAWYIQAASSPKDIVILVDRSGSMTGMRREIARHVVNNILDTLSNNDFVNIFTFSNTTEALIECFDDRLVQANMANTRALKEAMTDFKTEQIANFSLALTTAFKLLERYREERLGAQCNQAIMLVTDGVQYNYKEIFDEYNWQNLPFMPVRVFTYLIGREVSDVREVKWMACANQGYYVHLSTYAEVREQVLQYISVMARPLVLSDTLKPNPAWSPVYADVTDPKLTNWLWRNRQRNEQRERILLYRRNRTLFYLTYERDKKFVHQQKFRQDNYGELQNYHLMTSVSLPVYDKRPNATRVANLLGVAGTDVPVEYIRRLALPYRVGVNGYIFIVTNNGYILTHPDLRPVFQGILKPAYNRVDMMEVEVMDDDSEPREFDEALQELRKNIIFQKQGHVMHRIKSHLDEMRRIVVSNRHYYYMGITNTSFSLVLVLPEKYGESKVQHAVEDDIHRLRSNKVKGVPLTQYFTGNWTVHPDWIYCKYPNDKRHFESPEEELLHFLNKIDSPGWKWKECDSKLIKAVVADAKATDWFNQNILSSINKQDENECQFIKRFGITVAFLATHSGLTRWQEFPHNACSEREPSDEPRFHQLHNRAIDEVWYRRAVEQHFIDPHSFVYSVPFDIGDNNNTLVTASQAIFKEDSQKKAPAAVVGYQFYHSALHVRFSQITNNCGEMSCKRTCNSEELYCIVLDDSGYVIVSDDKSDTGKFFGDIRSDIMYQLIEEGVYTPIRMYDYQATCFKGEDVGSPATSIENPLLHFTELVRWAFGTLIYFARLTWGDEVDTMMYPDHGETAGEEELPRLSEKEFDRMTIIKKTKPEPCDTEMYIYTLTYPNGKSGPVPGYNKTWTDNCTRPFIVQPVDSSNMILLVINNICMDQPKLIPTPEPVEVDYNMSLTCYRVMKNMYPRRLYMSCINRNKNESDIELCGRGPKMATNKFLLFVSLFLLSINLT